MNARFMVLKMKNIIRILIFIGIGIALVALAVSLFSPESGALTGTYKEGTYYSDIILYNNPTRVAVTLSRDEIVSVELQNMGEVQEVFYPLFSTLAEDIGQKVVENQGVEGYEKSLENSMTESIVLEAIEKAIEKGLK